MNNLPSYELIRKYNISKRLKNYVEDGKIEAFDEELILKIKKINIFGIEDFYQIFELGLNIGTCGLTAKYLSLAFEDFFLITEGKCEILRGTPGAEDSQHAWLEVNEGEKTYIYDTTLMLKIDKDVAYGDLGYFYVIKKPSYELKEDASYQLIKKISRDQKSLKEKQKIVEAFRKFSESFE